MSVIAPVHIGASPVGPGHPCFVIAEIGVNHNGDMALAKRLIDAAAGTGVDCVKFQLYKTDELVTKTAPKAAYQVDTTGAAGAQRAMLEALELGPEQQAELAAYCADKGLLYICTPYDAPSVDALDAIGVAAYKIASTDTNNLPFLRYVASKGRPTILSTGMSDLGEVEASLGALLDGGLSRDQVVVLHCLSEYPAPVDQLNLRAMVTMRDALGVVTGYSDHTPGVGASPWAVCLGASMIEKHFTLDRGLEGPDHRASIEPDELRELVQTVRAVESALGDGVKRPAPAEIPNRPRMRKSVVARAAIPAGATLTLADLALKRPGDGLEPKWLDRLVGQKTRRALAPDELVTLAAVDWDA